jgi:hypothetical protein
VTSALLVELRALEAELHHPGVRSTRARLERLLHPAFHEVGRSGRAYTRETVIGFLETAGAPPTMDASDHVVHPLADGCALLTYRSTRASDGVTLRSSVWLKTMAGWQLFYHQGTPAA